MRKPLERQLFNSGEPRHFQQRGFPGVPRLERGGGAKLVRAPQGISRVLRGLLRLG